MTVYFLDGLGSNRYYAADLLAALADRGVRVNYLPLPGHPDNLEQSVVSNEALLIWLSQQLPETPVTLLGYSLGADIAAAYAYAYPWRVSQLILLDGACIDLSSLPLEEELAGAQAYLEGQVFGDMAEHLSQAREGSESWSANLERAEQEAYLYDEVAGIYRLRLNQEAVLGLLTARRQCHQPLQQADFSTPTTVIISDQPSDVLEQKERYLANCPVYVSYQVLPNSHHDFYMVRPIETAELIMSCLAEGTHG
ncbi:alpha/beta fold hydrolase [Streptococcus entericus]|uniref:alpha/beta fold hydrolase n=1 Tax=Streptococcus entericus TaxID=155680 RepID=UPI00035EB3F2|nr:alpha/beta hydrolase [Streptococcus entericus]